MNHVEHKSASDLQQQELKLAELERGLLTLTKKFNRSVSSSAGAYDSLKNAGEPEECSKKTSVALNKRNRRTQSGIRYRMRLYKDNGDRFTEHDHEPEEEEPDEDVSEPYWVKYIDATYQNGEPRPDMCEFVIFDTKLRDFISTKVIPSYVGHSGKAFWQKREVVLKPNFLEIVLNYTELENATHDTSPHETTKETRQRLATLLEMIRGKCDEQLFRPIDSSTIRDFRIPFRSCWRLFRPGTLVVSPWNRAGDLQVFRVQHIALNSDYSLITAWIWDWDGEQLRRTLFEFRIKKYDGEKYPAGLTCYPIEFFEHLTGEDAKQKLRIKVGRRSELFRKYTYEQLSNRHVLHYRGEMISGFPDARHDVPFLRGLLRTSDLLDVEKSYAKKLKVYKVGLNLVPNLVFRRED